MISREVLQDYLHSYLACDKVQDYAPNGLQVEGTKTIQTICTAVTASLEVIQEASHKKADALLVHHGFFWRGEDTRITGIKQKRIAALLDHKLNLFAYHLPLDCHLEIGNNACIGQLLKLQSIQSHELNKIPNLLWSGQLVKPLASDDLLILLSQVFGNKPWHFKGKDKPIQQIAWCSGAAENYLEEASRLGVDAYISGEVSLKTFYESQELGVHYFACGHHATERYGIQALGKRLAEKFQLAHYFIDSNNPV